MDLRVRDVARLLNVTEQTIYRWVQRGVLPAHRVAEQYRFNRVELQEWAAVRRHRVSPELFASDGSTPSLCAALERGGVFHRVPGGNREEALRSLSELPAIPPGVDREMLFQLFLAREALASTGLGEGLAIPHPRDPLVVGVREPHVLLAFLAEPLDFGALDGQPVRVFFALLSPSIRVHLQLLALLAFSLHDDALKALLREEASKEAILGRLRELESAGEKRC